MMRLLVALAVLPAAVVPGAAKIMDIKWDELPALPPSPGQTRQPGVAGPFAGVHAGALLVGGGANFPDKAPWDGGAKVWWNDIFVLEDLAGANPRWVTEKSFKLPRPIAYGVSVSISQGVVCVGGSDADRCYADAFMLSWDPAARTIRRAELPPMPEPLAFMAGALVGSTLYVVGGQQAMKGGKPSSSFWSLDLAKLSQPAQLKWRILPPWPGPPRIVPVAAAQRTRRGAEFFLFGGRVPRPGQRTEILTDAFAFDPNTGAWRKLPNIGGDRGVSVMAGTAIAAGDSEILLFGGDRGDLFLDLEAHDLAVEALRARSAGATAGRAELDAEIEKHLAAKKAIYAAHPGFGREVFAYDTRSEAWRIVTRSPITPQVTTIAVKFGDAVIIPSGEIRPGIRTPGVVRALPVAR